MIQNRVIEELNREIELAAQPGYRSRYDEGYGEPDHDIPPPRESPGKSERSDAGGDAKPSPHDLVKKDPDVSSGRSKPATEEFGKGVFE